MARNRQYTVQWFKNTKIIWQNEKADNVEMVEATAIIYKWIQMKQTLIECTLLRATD